MSREYDVIIIGAGAVGCAIARELSRFRLNVAVLEKEADVAGGTSGRNSAVVHAGFNNKPGSLMAKLCVEGNRGFEAVCSQLGVPYKKTGKLLVAFDDEDMKTLHTIIERGIQNGCKGLKIIDQEQVRQMAPQIGGIGAMYSPETAIFDPFTYCIALAENAVENGVSFYLEHEVTGIKHTDGVFQIHTDQQIFQCRCLINSAGLYSDRVSDMAGVGGYQLYPCRGEYYILDRIATEYLDIPVYPVPKAGIGGLGVHLTPTIHGNIIIGPSAEYIEARDDYSCTSEIMDKLFREATQLLPALKRKHIIGNYSGIRPKQAPPEEGGFRDFVIREEPSCPGLINLIGIESPGLTASVPISFIVRDMVAKHMELVEKKMFIAERRPVVRFREQSPEEQAKLIADDPDYGDIICRCQKVTKKEIMQAIENPLGARSLSAIKYRAWATTGRCSGGYCLTKIIDILVREYGVAPESIRYRSRGSELFVDGAK
ncbi:NAD(P)/FAD-dependent oxidoreductase [Agathobaculum sp.]|uniref:NAD(P)/FAD-dependent oxidoreductase n=1 Tax=Agathobaculum sp. TaxID=2048138 RepID=UPI0025C6931A|nr:NAD(P)/FAD-dependent oxidoreductase [Agathobaculum sp.]